MATLCAKKKSNIVIITKFTFAYNVKSIYGMTAIKCNTCSPFH